MPPWYRADLIAPIDVNSLSNWDDVVPSLKQIPGTVIGGEHYLVPVDFGFTAITFCHDLAPEYLEPENATWGFLWDPTYAGRLSMYDSLIDGVAVASVYAGLNPFDLDQEGIAIARRLLEEQLPLLRFYASDMSDVEQALVSGELVAGTSWNGSNALLKAEGVPVTFLMPSVEALNGNPQGPMTWVSGICLSLSVEPDMIEKAHHVMDAYLDPEAGVYEVTEWATGHSNARVYETVSDDVLDGAGLARDPEEVLARGIFQLEMKQEAELQTMFEEVKAGT